MVESVKEVNLVDTKRRKKRINRLKGNQPNYISPAVSFKSKVIMSVAPVPVRSILSWAQN